MNLTAIAFELKRRSKKDFKGKQFEAWLLNRTVSV